MAKCTIEIFCGCWNAPLKCGMAWLLRLFKDFVAGAVAAVNVEPPSASNRMLLL
jgi:hypothetical protein